MIHSCSQLGSKGELITFSYHFQSCACRISLLVGTFLKEHSFFRLFMNNRTSIFVVFFIDAFDQRR